MKQTAAHKAKIAATKKAHLRQKLLDMVGCTFNGWLVLECRDTEKKRGRFLCRCTTCGYEKEKQGDQIRYKATYGCWNCRNERLRLPDAAFRDLRRRYQAGAKIRGIAWEITDDTFRMLIKRECFYCGAPPELSFMYGHVEAFLYNGVDRVDSANGYTPNNVVACCEICNKAKRDMSLADFQAWLRRVAQYWAETH